MTSARSLARWASTRPYVQPLLVAALTKTGRVRLARRLSRDAPPEVITGELPDWFDERRLSMGSAGGRDQVAMRLFTHGWEAFEKPLPAFFTATVRSSDVILDVGANTGYYALLAASVGDVTVYAFEPLPTVADLCERNLRMNRQGGRISLVRQAVDQDCGWAQLYLPLTHHGQVETSASLAEGFRSAHSGVVTVQKTTIDAFTADLPRVDVIKVDVEGLEDRVLLGAQVTMAKHRPVVFLELLDCEDWTADFDALDRVREAQSYVAVQLGQAAICTGRLVNNPSSPNQALWPTERLGELRDVCRRLRTELEETGVG